MNKRKGIILTLALLLAAGAAVVGSRMIKNNKHNEVNTESADASEQISTEAAGGELPVTEVPTNSEDVEIANSNSDSKVDDGVSAGTDNVIDSGEKNSEADTADSHEISPDDFYISEIPDDIFAKMQGKSYKEDCTVPREDLRYVHVRHMGFDGEVKDGELVVSKKIADDVLEIFEELYKADYPIEKVRLVDEYDADDEASMSDNNSSAFNFRFISHTTRISKHGLGMAVDINTRYNPYVKTVDGKLSIEPANGADYVDRSKDFPHKIDHDDLCYKLFKEHGFTWGGDWTHSKDYQHFERDY